MNTQTARSSRSVERQVTGRETSDGAGVRLTRVLTQDLQRRLDPFLMLDAFASDDPDDYLAGFPDHPHRGFEAITYMRAGRMRHRDSAGHEGLIENGGMQWMTVGRGVVHSEMPQQENGTMAGFQLWLNLPARDKLCAPWYRNFTAAELPRHVKDGVSVTVLAGESHGIAGPVMREATAPLYLDLHMRTGSCFEQPLAAEMNAFACVYQGVVQIGRDRVEAGQMAILGNEGDSVLIGAAEDAHLILLAGRPLNEPIAQSGPFVMNTMQEIQQAVADFRDGHLA
jgi:redox-sensitive bicupin YhaK (pirin superfamily)